MSAENIYPPVDQGIASPDTGFDPVAVKLSPEDLAAIKGAAEFTPVIASLQTFLFTGIAQEQQPQPFIPADLRRRRAYWKVVASLGAGTINGQGQVTAPTAGQTIASIPAASIPAGWYVIEWAVNLTGAAAAADINNFRLRQGTTALDTSSNPGQAGNFPQANVGPVFLTGTQSASIIAVSLGTAGVTYAASMVLIPASPPSGYVLIGALNQVDKGLGGRFFPGQSWETRAHGPLFIAGDGITPGLAVTLLVERDTET